MAASEGWAKIEAEIAKCDVLCEPCHYAEHGLL